MKVQIELEKSFPQITQTFRLHILVPFYYTTATGKNIYIIIILKYSKNSTTY